MNFDEILAIHRLQSLSERDKGNRFERLMQQYLLTEPLYASKFKKVWLWGEFQYKTNFGDHDIGIDLVSLTNEGEYWAIQCKCYQEDARIDKAEVDSFLATSGRSFKDEHGTLCKFVQRLWISTTNNWTSNANETLENQNPPVIRLNLHDLQESKVDWMQLERGVHGEKARLAKKELRPHQREALESVKNGFKEADRGKLIMACGTGKTFTSLRIAEEIAGKNGIVLFLVPSIALLGQTLREWTSDAQEEINAICICSDAEVSKVKRKNEDSETFSVVDLALPASTDVKQILNQFENIEMNTEDGLTIVFSTYQSIDVISQTQKRLESIGSKFAEFDLIICDEAHRTTGVTLVSEDESSFVKVHNNDFIKAKKRLYMTATPRIFGEESKSKAAQADAVLCSMDDANLYGIELYRIGFGEAVEKGLLSDYKVLILTLSEQDITPEVQKIIKSEDNEINTDDISKLIGCVNAMSKQIIGDKKNQEIIDPEPMRRAVAFCQSIKVSRKITDTFNVASGTYKDSVPELKKSTMVNLKSEHIDGGMSATERDKLMAWLKSEPKDPQEARVLTNVRCLSEGVDVPSLDAVMFLSARNSQVDVVQSVGRVMRRSPGKKYGYIIIPIVVPSDVDPKKALDDNERYKVVWTVLNALRAHDDRFNAIVNKIDLNKKRPKQIFVGGVDPDGDGNANNDSKESKREREKAALQTRMHFENLQSVIYAKLVQKVGDRRYWEQWAKSVAEIAERQTKRIKKLVENKGEHQMAFVEFLDGLHKNINPSITSQQAIEMLSQHIITKPVFDALFENYSFVNHNAVSLSMQKVLDKLEESAVEKEDLQQLESFYDSVRKRAEGIDNAEGKQRIILELYDNFFKSAFPKMVDQLGIVYTPVEVVDFIINSVNDVLQQEFGKSLSDENVNILDPFTGTGTFITRLLQSGLIKKEDIERKYKNEIFANEIVLLTYYIAAVNIENTYHDINNSENFETFKGITLTDTFQLYEESDSKLFSESLAENSERVQRQKDTPIQVIIGNPPYSVGQQSANDNAQNQKYEKLDKRISETYAKGTNAVNKNSLYNSYIKAFRWSSDRIDKKSGGIVCFVSDGGWLDNNAHDGFRKCLEKEFSHIWVFNLRGNQRTSGELSKQEGGKIFGSGSRTPISITLLVKKPNHTGIAKISYKDIGNYLTRETKLSILRKFQSVNNSEMNWHVLEPNEHGDWLSKRNNKFSIFVPITPRNKFDYRSISYFSLNSRGLETSRDAWLYNSSIDKLINNIKSTIRFYNNENERINKILTVRRNEKIVDIINTDSKSISWSSSLISMLLRNEPVEYEDNSIQKSLYRPFYKQFLYRGQKLTHRRGQFDEIFPSSSVSNLVICVSGVGGSKEISTIITNTIPDLNLLDAGTQCFPLYYYEKQQTQNPTLYDNDKDEYARKDGITDYILNLSQTQYGDKNITKEDIFYYVYGFLHSPEYRNTFANDLKKMLPRIPLVDNVRDFWAFSKAGRKLAELHINYEKAPPYEGVKVSGTQHGDYHVTKMKILAKDKKESIIYNDFIKIEKIPLQAYEYVVNGKSAIEWILERYQIKTDTDSGIVNDPNDWAKEVLNQRYILDLLLSVINVSIQTIDIVNNLPKISFDSEKKD